ncbi:protein kinase-like protein [Penicillium argentinense]|uniref:Protein kinase-like protein n=1 Tax=Penicillium argentinense TaxID=1131581 RepID=A0A9W9JY02_9EURO|nr:protein kinase-like protein [Penicillium argentinense]KAJ5085531.1 protein kinase-like protein [Penicillium argentinense]
MTMQLYDLEEMAVPRPKQQEKKRKRAQNDPPATPQKSQAGRILKRADEEAIATLNRITDITLPSSFREDGWREERSGKTYSRCGGLFIKKYPKPPRGKFKKSEFQNEFDCLKFLRTEKPGIPVPRPIWAGEMNGYWYLITEYIEGAPFGEITYRLSPDQIDRVIRRIDYIQESVHNIQADAVGGPSGIITTPIPDPSTDHDNMKLVFCHRDLHQN